MVPHEGGGGRATPSVCGPRIGGICVVSSAQCTLLMNNVQCFKVFVYMFIKIVLNLKMWASYCSFMSFHSNYYLPRFRSGIDREKKKKTDSPREFFKTM